MKKRIYALLVCVPFSIMTATAADVECAKNVRASGGFLIGRKFETSVAYPNAKESVVFRAAHRVLVEDGLQIGSADSNLGTVTATQDVPVGLRRSGKVLYSIVVDSDGAKGSKVSFVVQTPGAFVSGESDGREALCTMIASLNSKVGS